MSSAFKVDVVATPHLNLCGAVSQDLSYREKNGSYPKEAKSQMAKEQEKLNKFLQYVNESFIIKGFTHDTEDSSGFTAVTSANTANLVLNNMDTVLGNFELSHGDNTQIATLFSLTGEIVPTGSAQVVATLTLKENNSVIKTFYLSSGSAMVTFSSPFLLINRTAGITRLNFSIKVTNGRFLINTGNAVASALVLE